MRRFVPEICSVECGSRGKGVSKFDVFAPYIWWEGSNFFGGAFLNRHHFRPRPTGQVWLRYHGWSFIYDDKIKNYVAVKYNGLAFGSHNKWSKNVEEKPHCMSCRYWGLNDSFCCVHRSRDSQCISVPQNCPFPWRIPTPSNLNRVSAPKRHLDRFSRFCTSRPCEQHTDRQTALRW